MQIIKSLTPGEVSPCVATIGFFDGFHTGHRRVVGQMRDIASRKGLATLVITFDEHPRRVLQKDYLPSLLTTLPEKLALIEASGADYCLVLPFTTEMAALTAYDFMRTVLRDTLSVRTLVAGHDHRFGRGASESFAQYKAYGRELGIDVEQTARHEAGDVVVSSSAIRRFLEAGNIVQANTCLGYPYALSGRVVEGRKMGRTIGFPTANLAPFDPLKMIPAGGVYAITATVEGQTYGGMLNIGTRPTFDEESREVSIEAHLFDFDRNIYGLDITLHFVRRLRFEQKFDSVEALCARLAADRTETLAVLASQA